MHKTQVFIRDDQYEALKRLISTTGKKQSALIRESIDIYLKKAKKDNQWKQNILDISGSLSEEEADEMKQDMTSFRSSWKNRIPNL